jgi:LacI family transcriptional regulator
MGVTIRDVAEEASVSATTVSRVFNHDHLVNSKTREHVMSVARRMGYSPNATARSLSQGRTRSLGILLPAPHGEFFSELIRGVDDVAQHSDHFLLIASSHYDPEEGRSALQSLSGRVDGIVIMTPRVQSDALMDGLELGVPVVFVNSELGDTPYDLFSIENREGAVRVVTHLIEQGNTRIAAITGPAGSADAEDRLAGYYDALERHDLSEGPIVEGAFTQESGYEAGQQIADGPERPDAVFACNDYMAIGAMAAFREAGIHVPNDIAVAGFDDIASARYASPSLTTVHVPVYDIGRRAGERLVQQIQSDTPLEAQQVQLPLELKARSSTKPQP